MPDLTPDEADRCRYCGAEMRFPPDCCAPACDDYRREWNQKLLEAPDFEFLLPPAVDPEEFP